MATEISRSQILSVDDAGDWTEEIESALIDLKPQLTHPVSVRIATTKPEAYADIERDGDKILAVIADRRLKGFIGAEGEDVAEFALQRGIPNVAILTGDASNVRVIEGVEILDKGMPRLKFMDYLENVLRNSGLLKE